MVFTDDDLTHLAANGLPALPQATTTGYADNENARIWYATFGNGPAVILLHGGLGNANNWGYQVPRPPHPPAPFGCGRPLPQGRGEAAAPPLPPITSPSGERSARSAG